MGVHPPQPSALRERVRLPPHGRRMRIGLFGGTFDPPHLAHFGACLLAMKRLRLDRVWWLVTPGNPLKDTRGLAPLAPGIPGARMPAPPPRLVPLCHRQRRRAGAGPLPHSGTGSSAAAGPPAAGLGVPAWAEVTAVLD